MNFTPPTYKAGMRIACEMDDSSVDPAFSAISIRRTALDGKESER